MYKTIPRELIIHEPTRYGVKYKYIDHVLYVCFELGPDSYTQWEKADKVPVKHLQSLLELIQYPNIPNTTNV